MHGIGYIDFALHGLYSMSMIYEVAWMEVLIEVQRSKSD
jgi:hypothetical protein